MSSMFRISNTQRMISLGRYSCSSYCRLSSRVVRCARADYLPDDMAECTMTSVYYDFETCINSKGQKRKQTIPIEIAMLNDETNEYTQCAFWPLAFPIEDALKASGANVAASLHCVRKVFGRIPTEHDEECLTLKEARARVETFIEGVDSNVLVAHNGRSFDDPIYREWFKANPDQNYMDSLKVLRKMRPDLLSHSLPVLSKALRRNIGAYMNKYGLGGPRQQHRALYDCVALKLVMDRYPRGMKSVANLSASAVTKSDASAVANLSTKSDASAVANPNGVPLLWSGGVVDSAKSDTKWTDLPGIGIKTSAALRPRFATPKDFIEWATDYELCEIKTLLKALGVRRAPTVIRILQRGRRPR